MMYVGNIVHEEDSFNLSIVLNLPTRSHLTMLLEDICPEQLSHWRTRRWSWALSRECRPKVGTRQPPTPRTLAHFSGTVQRNQLSNAWYKFWYRRKQNCLYMALASRQCAYWGLGCAVERLEWWTQSYPSGCSQPPSGSRKLDVYHLF